MSSNNGKFANNFFTQINGATIGGPESASITIFLEQFTLIQLQKMEGLLFQQTGKGTVMIRSI